MTPTALATHRAWLADQFERLLATLPPGCGYAYVVGWLLSAAAVPEERSRAILAELTASSRLPPARTSEVSHRTGAAGLTSLLGTVAPAADGGVDPPRPLISDVERTIEDTERGR